MPTLTASRQSAERSRTASRRAAAMVIAPLCLSCAAAFGQGYSYSANPAALPSPPPPTPVYPHGGELPPPQQTPFVPQAEQGIPGQGVVGPGPGEEMVVDVQVRGNTSMPTEKVLSYIRTRPGRVFDMHLIEEDVRQLNRSRNFVWVKPLSQSVPGGRRVVFEVLERATLKDVKIIGPQKIRTSLLHKEIAMKPGDPADPLAVEDARRKIEDFYTKKGFSNVRVTVFEGDKPGDRRAVFVVNEGRKQRILWTNFVGNTIASDGRLRTQIRSKPPTLYLFGGELNRKQVDEDVERLTAYYRGLGFFFAEISREIEFDSADDWLTLTFYINEGPRYEVRNISVVGNTKFVAATLLTDTKLRSGEYFQQAKMNADVAAMTDKYGCEGYVFSKIEPQLRFSEEPGQLDIVYEVQEGDRYRVGRIDVQIEGEYPHTRLSTVLNQLSLKPGDIVDLRKLRESERRLRGSGLFAVDPATGDMPKIVFSPPELDSETQVAEKPSRSSGTGRYRGQSPDTPVHYSAQQPAGSDASARPLVLRVECAPLDPQQVSPPQPNELQRFSPQSPPASSVPQDTAPPSVYMSPEPRPSVYHRLPSQSSADIRARLIPCQYTTTTSNTYRAPQPWQRFFGMPTGQPSTGTPSTYANGAAAPPSSNYAAGLAQPSSTREMVPVQPPGQPTAYPQYPSTAGGYGAAANAFPAAPGATASTASAVQPVQYLGPAIGRPFGAGIVEPGSPLDPGLNDPAEDLSTRPLDLTIRTKETQTGKLMLGAGINSDAGLMGNFVLDEQNFDWTRFPTSWEDIRNATAWRGAGQRLRIELVPGSEVQRYMFNFQEPYLFNTEVALGLSGFYYDRLYTEWDEQRLGGRISLGYHFTRHLTGSLAVRAEKINVRNPIDPNLPELAEVVGDNALYGFSGSLAHDTRDSSFLPTEGHLIELMFEQVVGSFTYSRAELELRQYFLLHERPDGSGRHVVSLGGRGAVSSSDTPIYDHYYAGGFSTVRGFDYRGISPISSNGIRVGGEFMLLASAEYLFPITADDMLRGVVFCDTGTVQPTISDWNQKYRVAPGFGLRIVIPAMGPAPIALDFAFPLVTEDYDQEEVFSFWLGFMR